jgi:hypothetical protein
LPVKTHFPFRSLISDSPCYFTRCLDGLCSPYGSFGCCRFFYSKQVLIFLLRGMESLGRMISKPRRYGRHEEDLEDIIDCYPYLTDAITEVDLGRTIVSSLKQPLSYNIQPNLFLRCREGLLDKRMTSVVGAQR